MFCGKRNLANLEKLQERRYVLFSVTRPLHTKICWNEETSYQYLSIVLDAWALKYSNASMV